MRKTFELVLAVVIVIAVPEAIFALAGIGEQEFIRPDKVLGFAPMEGKHVTWRQEGFSRLTINSFGMPDYERTLAKPAGTFRIAVIGDSMTQGMEVARSETFCQQLQELLNASSGGSGTKYEVMNFGVSSYNMGQVYLVLLNKALRFKPDLVIVPVSVNSILQLAPNAKGGFMYARPSFFVGAGGKLIQDHSVQNLWQRSRDGARMRNTAWLRRHSHIWGVVSANAQAVSTWYTKTVAWLRSPNRWFHSSPAAQSGGSSDSTAEAMPSADAGATKFLWPIEDALIGAISDACQSNHCQLMLARLAGTSHLHNDVETAMLDSTAKRRGLPLIDLTPEFDKCKTNHFYVFHMTPEGHTIVARGLFDFIQQQGLCANTSVAER